MCLEGSIMVMTIGVILALLGDRLALLRVDLQIVLLLLFELKLIIFCFASSHDLWACSLQREVVCSLVQGHFCHICSGKLCLSQNAVPINVALAFVVLLLPAFVNPPVSHRIWVLHCSYLRWVEFMNEISCLLTKMWTLFKWDNFGLQCCHGWFIFFFLFFITAQMILLLHVTVTNM